MNQSMIEASEAVKAALLEIAQDTGCNPQSIKLVTEALRQWEHVESSVISDLHQKIISRDAKAEELLAIIQGNAAEIASLRRKLQEAAVAHNAIKEGAARLAEQVRAARAALEGVMAYDPKVLVAQKALGIA